MDLRQGTGQANGRGNKAKKHHLGTHRADLRAAWNTTRERKPVDPGPQKPLNRLPGNNERLVLVEMSPSQKPRGNGSLRGVNGGGHPLRATTLAHSAKKLATANKQKSVTAACLEKGKARAAGKRAGPDGVCVAAISSKTPSESTLRHQATGCRQKAKSGGTPSLTKGSGEERKPSGEI